MTVEPGDALLVYSGRETWQADYPDRFIGEAPNPGLHASCVKAIRDWDVALLGWDMMDAKPDPYGFALGVHPVLYAFGVALLDNALLEPLAEVCAETGRYEMALMIAPLRVEGGTGSPVNPIALF